MQKVIKSISVAAFLLVLMSLTKAPNANFIGTYGVSDSNPNKIELTLNADHTFTYKDFSNAEKQIDVQGNWEAKNDVVTLTNYTSDFSFHNKWKIKMEGKVAKSRKGMTFYTLVKI
jgi:uncharacterized protein (DUF2147 family)